jgi:CubicO group peptidase (beta-lactamase class C family)
MWRLLQQLLLPAGQLLLQGAAAALSSGWDAGLQGAEWRQCQRAELRGDTGAAATAGPLEPCPVPAIPTPLPNGSLPPQIAALVATTEADLNALFAKSKATGGAAVLVYGDQLLLSMGFGAKKAGGAAGDIDGDTIFRIGSISKVFTDLLLYRLAEEGAVDPFSPVTDLAPDFSPAWPAGATPTPKGFSLRDLGSHMAGLARYAPCNFGACNISLGTALNRMQDWTLLFEPGTDLAYSNTGFGLLGRLLELVDAKTKPKGEPWEASLLHLATVLGMSSTTSTPPTGPDNSRLAYGYEQGQLVPQQELGFSNPAGGVYSSAHDMAKLLSFLLRDGAARDDRTGSGQPMDAATVRRWVRDRVQVNPSNLNCSECAYYTEWGVPWQILRAEMDSDDRMAGFSRFNLISKDGSIPGYNAQLVFQPELKLGLFTAMTTGDGREVPFFSDTILELGFKVIPPFYAYLQSTQNQSGSGFPSRLPPNPAEFEGTYSAAVPGGEVSLKVGRAPRASMGDSILYILTSTNLGFREVQPLAWVRGESFVMLPMPSDLCFSDEAGQNWPLRFHRAADAQGKIDAVTIDGLGLWPAKLEKQKHGQQLP